MSCNIELDSINKFMRADYFFKYYYVLLSEIGN